MKKNFIFATIMVFTLMLSPITVYAAETNDVCSDIAVQRSETIYQHIYDYGASIKSFEPYTSKTFRAKADRLSILFGANGNYGNQYTYYLEERNSNGSWTVIDSHTVSYSGSMGTAVYVTPNNTFRVRATTTDKRGGTIFLEVYEILYD